MGVSVTHPTLPKMTVYNKIFTKILDSSIWLESTTTRLVWLTFIAAMDEDGYVAFASVANLAHRARVSTEDAQGAVDCLEGPDPDSSDPENEGRRIEKVPGGWLVLNSSKYRDMVTRTVIKEQTRIRVERHRAKKRPTVTCNADVTQRNATVTQSDTASTTPIPRKRIGVRKNGGPPLQCAAFDEFWAAYPNKANKAHAEKSWVELGCASILPKILTTLRAKKLTDAWTKEGGRFIPHPASWLNARGWEDEGIAATSVNKDLEGIRMV